MKIKGIGERILERAATSHTEALVAAHHCIGALNNYIRIETRPKGQLWFEYRREIEMGTCMDSSERYFKLAQNALSRAYGAVIEAEERLSQDSMELEEIRRYAKDTEEYMGIARDHYNKIKGKYEGRKRKINGGA